MITAAKNLTPRHLAETGRGRAGAVVIPQGAYAPRSGLMAPTQTDVGPTPEADWARPS